MAEGAWGATKQTAWSEGRIAAEFFSTPITFRKLSARQLGLQRAHSRRSTLTPAMVHCVGVRICMPRRTADRRMAWLGPHALAQGLFASRSLLAAQAKVAANSSSVKKAPWRFVLGAVQAPRSKAQRSSPEGCRRRPSAEGVANLGSSFPEPDQPASALASELESPLLQRGASAELGRHSRAQTGVSGGGVEGLPIDSVSNLLRQPLSRRHNR
eukprot:1733886-Amphidinium_carterae.1